MNDNAPPPELTSYIAVSSVFAMAILACVFFSGYMSFEFARLIWSWLSFLFAAAFIARLIIAFKEGGRK